MRRVSAVGTSVLPLTCSCVLSAGRCFALGKESELRRAGKELVIGHGTDCVNQTSQPEKSNFKTSALENKGRI